jgi:RNA recognition motif-containing protein
VMKSDLEELFQGVNGLKDVRLVVKNRVSQASRGMAYVEFETVEGMNEGLNFNGKIFRGHPLNIQKSQPRIKSSESAHTKEAARDGSWKTNPYTVYLGGIQNDTTTEKLINTFTEIIGGVEDVFIPQAKRNKPKNYALIQFASEKDVTKLVESSGPDSILQLLKQKLDNNKLTVRRSRFDIEEFRREQETQRLKHNKVDASNQSRKRATPLPGKLIPHSKPATRLSILSFVPTTVKKKANSTNPTTKQSKAPEKDDTKLNISSISSSIAGSKTQDDFRKLFVNN